MNVELPDGTIVEDVPEGTTKAQLLNKLAQNGYDGGPLQRQMAAPAIGAAGLAEAARDVGRTRNIVGKLGTGIGEAAQRLAHGASDLATGYYFANTPQGQERKQAREVAHATMEGAGPLAQVASLATDIGVGMAGGALVGRAATLPQTAGPLARAIGGARSLPVGLSGIPATAGVGAVQGAIGSPDDPLMGAMFGGGSSAAMHAVPAVARAVQAKRAGGGARPSAGRLLAEGEDASALLKALEKGAQRAQGVRVPVTTAQAARLGGAGDASTRLAGRELGTRAVLPEEFSAIVRGQSEGLYDAAQRATREAELLPQRLISRRAQTEPLREYAMKEARAGDFAPIVENQALKMVTGPGGANPSIRRVGEYVLKEMEQHPDPKRLHMIRKTLADRLEGPLAPGIDELGAATKAARRETVAMIGAIDNALDEATQGQWSVWLNKYASESRRVDSSRASQELRELLDASGRGLLGSRPETTAHTLGKAVERAGKSDFPEGRFLPGTKAKLDDLVQFAKEIEEPMRALKRAGTASGGSQTTVQTAQVLRTLSDLSGVPYVGQAVNWALTALNRSEQRALAELLVDPQKAVNAIKAAQAAGKPLSPPQSAFVQFATGGARAETPGIGDSPLGRALGVQSD